MSEGTGRRLAGRVALVTGANSPLGIGAATAKAFAGEGAAVYITSFRLAPATGPDEIEKARREGVGGPAFYEALGQEPPETIVRAIEGGGGRAACGEFDLADPASAPALFEACEEALGPVDILVNNHAHWVPETFDPALVTDKGYGMKLADASTMDAHFAVNTRAPALMMAEFVRRYLARRATWGRIINISTDAADAHAGAVSYAASKHALESYSRSAAHELGRYGITVNIVAPGPVQTGWLAPAEEAGIAKKTPLGRVGRPEDIAGVLVFLATEEARWLTGQLLYVGGGWRMSQ
jgi:3-oxoacyl-[acyl-carrier protein] reductase